MAGGFSFGGTANTAIGAGTSSGFGLGASAANTPQTGGFSFGTATPQQNAAKPGGGFSFGQASTGGGGFNLGTPQQPQQQQTQQAATGFNFASTTQQPQQQSNTSFTLGNTQQQANKTGFNLGTPAQTQNTSGLTLGASAQAQAPAGGLSLGATATAAVQPTTGFALGTAQKTTGGLTMGTTTTQQSGGLFATPQQATTSAGGLSLGGLATAAGGFSLGGVATTTTSSTLGGTTTNTGLTLGATKPLTLGAVATTSTAGGGLGTISTTTTTTKTGLTFGIPSTSSTVSFGGLGGTTTTTTATGIFANTSTVTKAPTGGLSGFTATTTVSSGLGGVDPKTNTTGSSAAGSAAKAGDSKAVKETPIVDAIHVTLDQFKTYVKEQKSVREKILRMSSTPMFKVQEEVANLKQLLSQVSNGLQRNAITITKLKQDTAMELKHAEISHRTKETPPGLQYEHTAPTEYFQRLVDGFESQMVLYRQHIEEMENHLTSLNQGTHLTPQELSFLLAKIHETFIGLAAQLQKVHEAVKTQKEFYLSYRRACHGDDTDVFEKVKKAKQKTGSGIIVTVGPTPFTGLSTTAATAMASIINNTQQPTGFGGLQGQTATTNTGTGGLFGAPATSLGSGFGASKGFGFNTATTQQSTAFGASSAFNLSAPANTATVRPLGTSGGGLFGGAAASGTQSGGLGFNQTAPSGGALGTPAAGGFGSTMGLGSQTANGTFQLQNPPLGSKRGKKQ